MSTTRPPDTTTPIFERLRWEHEARLRGDPLHRLRHRVTARKAAVMGPALAVVLAVYVVGLVSIARWLA